MTDRPEVLDIRANDVELLDHMGDEGRTVTQVTWCADGTTDITTAHVVNVEVYLDNLPGKVLLCPSHEEAETVRYNHDDQVRVIRGVPIQPNVRRVIATDPSVRHG